MAHRDLADVMSHSGFPGSIKNVLTDFESRITALEAKAAADDAMMADLRGAYAESVARKAEQEVPAEELPPPAE